LRISKFNNNCEFNFIIIVAFLFTLSLYTAAALNTTKAPFSIHKQETRNREN